MPAQDLATLTRELVSQRGSALRRLLMADEAEWGAHEENTARALDLLEHQVQQQWSDRIFDPDDQDARRDRLEAKRNGIKPPKSPLILPVALRPEKVAERRFQQYVESASALIPLRERQSVSSSDFDSAMGLEVEVV